MHMDEDTEQLLKDLRNRSKTLLALTETNSMKIDNEIEKLRLNNSTFEVKNFQSRDRKETWNLRNDSSAINNLLHPDCRLKINNLKRMSVPSMRPLERVLIPSKNLSHLHCLCITNRKPIKECYCNVEIKKIQTRSPRTIQKSIPSCNYCKNHICRITLQSNDNNIGDNLTPPISCETIRRIQKINYNPQSEFLRNVQRKVSVLKNVPYGDCPDSCPRSSYYHKLRTDKTLIPTETDRQSKIITKKISKPSIVEDSEIDKTSMLMETDTRSKITAKKLSKSSIVDSEILDSIRRVSSSLIDEEEEEEEKETKEKLIDKINKGIQVPSKKQSKTKFHIKRTISSKKCVSEGYKNKSASISSSASQNIKRSFANDCLCYDESKPDNKLTKDSERKDLETYRVYSDDNEEVDRKLKKWSHKKEDLKKPSMSSSSSSCEVDELRKFREQNYFDTHGSSQTLLSSESSGSLQEYTLNDRLFAEPYKRIHRKDLVVTMPPCSTIQKKRVHYFPRHIVRQEKSNCNINYKKKRCQSCPLTGHAIDLGISKPRPVLNSLALKYQKRLP